MPVLLAKVALGNEKVDEVAKKYSDMVLERQLGLVGLVARNVIVETGIADSVRLDTAVHAGAYIKRPRVARSS